MSATTTARVETRFDSAQYAVKHSTDPEAQSRAMTGWEHAYQQVDRTPFRGSVTELLLGSLQVAAEEIANPFAYRGGIRSGYANFMLSVPTAGNIVCGGRPLGTDAIFCFPRNHAHRAFASGPVKFVSVSIDGNVLRERAASLFGGDIPDALLESARCIVEPETIGRFRSCVTGVLAEVAEQPTLVSDDRWCTDTRERVLEILLDVVALGTTQSRKLPQPSTRAYIVDKAAEYMRAHLENPPVMRQVCDAVRVCPRTLRYSFEDIVGASPNQFLLALRLQQVRHELLAAGSSGSIQLIAQRYGFWHMSRFARFYQQAFGELPSATCRRAERTPASGRRGRAAAALTRKLN